MVVCRGSDHHPAASLSQGCVCAGLHLAWYQTDAWIKTSNHGSRKAFFYTSMKVVKHFYMILKNNY